MTYDPLEECGLTRLVGKKIQRIAMSEGELAFGTDQGLIAFQVEGDCCSHSYFYDFYGVEKLLVNGPVTEVGAVDIDESTVEQHECTQAYGFKIISTSPVWGDQTSVFSFRNDSNGYYGGWMYPLDTSWNNWDEFFFNNEIGTDTILS
jgi:hypothetical protein